MQGRSLASRTTKRKTLRRTNRASYGERGINAQEPTCDGIDTTSWKRVITIPIDIKCVDIDYSKFYSVRPNIKIFTDI